MLKKRVIISLLLNDGELSRTKQFVPDYVYTQNFVTVDSIDELFIIDITRGGRSKKFTKYVKAIVDKCFVPICVGGHIRTLEDVKWAICEFGADTVLINAEAHRNGRLIPEIAEKWGSQAVTVGIDVVNDMDLIDAGYMPPVVRFDQGKAETGCWPHLWAKVVERDGAGQIFLQSIDRDGSLAGYDLETLKEVTEAVNIPVVIGGGCGNYRHMQEAFAAGADGCATSNIFHFTETTISNWKLKLQEAGVPVRVE